MKVRTIVKNLRDGIRKAYARVFVPLYKGCECRSPYIDGYLDTYWIDRKISCVVDKKAFPVGNTTDLSLVIPLYNSLGFIEKCLATLINQKTQYTYEIILVNDGSKDKSLDYAQKMQREYPNIIKVVSQENQGISAARNQGIECACGEYIGFIDHDDWVSELYVERLIASAKKEAADVVKCGYSILSEGKTISSHQMKSNVIEGKMGERIFQYAGYIWGGIYRRSLFDQIRFPVGFWYEDMISRILVYRQSMKFVNVGEELYYKLHHKRNASDVVWSKKEYKTLEQLYLTEGIVRDNSKLGLEEDAVFYRCILIECTDIMLIRISGLPESMKKQIFLRINQMLSNLFCDGYEKDMPEKLKRWNKAILMKNYKVWKLMGYLKTTTTH